MRKRYIATFFNHFGAIRFKKMCDARGWEAKLSPVPRALSSSCGTCVYYSGEEPLPEGAPTDEIDRIVLDEGTGSYACVYRAEE